MNKATIGQEDPMRAYQRTDYVWSKLRHIYHTAGCRWERRILPGNYQHGPLIKARGYGDRRECHVCWP